MEATELQNQTVAPEKPREWRAYDYYSRDPVSKPTKSYRSVGFRMYRLGLYVRLVLIGAITVIVGGIFPVLLSYEFCFKPLITITCNECQIVNASPYFAFDYVIATVLGILGFMMPIFVLYIFIKILRSQRFRHDIFD